MRGDGLRQRWRAVVALALAVALAGCLGGCGLLSPRGQSFATAVEQVESLPGVASATVEMNDPVSGLTRSVSIRLSVALDDGVEIIDKEAFVDFLVAVGWSVGTTYPNSGVYLSIDPEVESGIDWGQVAADAGWEHPAALDPYRVYAPANVVEQELGSWPGVVPDVPASLMTVGVAASPPPGGQSFKDAIGQVVSLAASPLSVGVKGSLVGDGGNRSTAIVVDLYVQSTRVADREALVNFLLAVAWSTNVVDPVGGLVLRFDVDDDDPIDWVQVARDAGWTIAETQGRGYLRVDAQTAEERLGPWPGPVPEIPPVLAESG